MTPARADDDPKMVTFLEGFFAGLVIGGTIGIVVIIGLRHIQQRPRSDNSSRPDWTYPPYVPPSTNSLPDTNFTKLVLDAGDAVAGYDLSDLGLADPRGGSFTNGFVTCLETSVDAQNWQPLYHLAGWMSEAGRLNIVYDAAWQPVLTNYNRGTFSLLDLPLPSGDRQRFYRVSSQ